ncbi:MAG: hypothetical protein JXR39_02425 [Marinilabiliaceae bacterium]|nr:hypothetical protein [Marinilabiliaceae bacterium]
MEKIHFDQVGCNMTVNKYIKACNILQKCINDYASLEIGNADQNVLNVILDNNAGTFRDRFETHLTTSIEKTTKSPLIVDNLKKSVGEKFDAWQETAQNTHQSILRIFNDGMATYSPFKPEYFKLDGQTVTFDKQALEDDFSIILNTEDRKHLWGLATDAAAKLNELQQFISERNTAIFGTDVLPDVPGHCFQVDEKRCITVNPYFIELV